jgi:hypothetical protein
LAPDHLRADHDLLSGHGDQKLIGHHRSAQTSM